MRIWIFCFTGLLMACSSLRTVPDFYPENGTEICRDLYQKKLWEEALQCLAAVPENQKDQLFFDLRGSSYQQIGNYSLSVSDFEIAISLDSLQKNPFLHFKLGRSLWLSHQYLRAKESFQIYEDLVQNPSPDIRIQIQYYIRSARTADSLFHHPRSFDLRLLPEEINSPEHELGASLTFDRRTMVFTRRDRQEDLFSSHRMGEKWTEALPVEHLNSTDNEGAAAISGDGQTLVFTACNRPDGAGSCDIFYSKKTSGGWTPPQLIPGINSRYWDSQPTLSPDGRAMIFSSERPGGYGGRDLWLSVLDAEDRWIPPVNLGPEINSPGNEENPHLHTDEQTLYFTSDHWPGFGGRDLFYAERLKGNTWSSPQNLGYPVNSHQDEEGIFVTSSGDTAIISSARSGQFDLYSFALDPEIQPQKAYLFQLLVYDFSTKKPVDDAQIKVLDWEMNKIIRSARTDEEGFAAFLMKAGRAYGVNIEKEGFAFHSDRLHTGDHLTGDVRDTLWIQPIIRDQPIILENVLFETGKAILQSEAYFELDQLADFLNNNKNLRIKLTGHTDNTGDTKDNLELSKARANAVKDYLVSHDIRSDRIQTEGMGESAPLSTNDTEEGRQLNRRTEMRIL